MVWVLPLAIVLGLVVLDLCVHARFVKMVMHWFEQGPPFHVEPAGEDPRAEPVQFTTPDGLTLRGGLYHHLDRTPRGVIVFCHEYGGNHWSAMAYAGAVWEAGFDLFAFDFRNQGQSDSQPGYEPLHWLTEYEVTDTLAAIEHVASRPELAGLPIGLYGISRGAGAALVAAARNAAVEAVVGDGAYATDTMMQHYATRWSTIVVPPWLYRLIPWWHTRMTLALVRWRSQQRRGIHYANVERWLPRLGSRDVLLISGARDSYVLPELTQTLCQKIGSPDKQPWIVAGAKHNQARQVDPDEYDRRLVDFFAGMPGAEEPVAAEIEPTAAEAEPATAEEVEPATAD